MPLLKQPNMAYLGCNRMQREDNEMILVDTKTNGIGMVTLNRPDRHNAFNEAVITQLTNILIQLQHDATIRVILLCAKGKNFSAGADLEWMKSMMHYSQEENIADVMKLVKLLRILSSATKPTIALAKGITMGGGVGLLACCDIVIAAADAQFCFSEAKLGLIPATIAPYIIHAIGPRAAQYLFLTAKKFDAHTALNLGLIHEIISPAQTLDEEGMITAKRLLENGPEALTLIKQQIAQISPGNDDQAAKETAQLLATVRASAEAQEGLSAFLEKRSPRWHGTT